MKTEMKDNMKELNMNEMEQVSGGNFFVDLEDVLRRIFQDIPYPPQAGRTGYAEARDRQRKMLIHTKTIPRELRKAALLFTSRRAERIRTDQTDRRTKACVQDNND